MNYIELYRQIAEQNGFQFQENQEEIKVLGSDNGHRVCAKYVFIKKEEVIYYAYDMYAPKACMSNTYAGFYVEIDLGNSDLECNISRKTNFVIDFLLNGMGKKTGNRFVDRHLIIKTNDIQTIRHLITKSVTQKYIKLHHIISPVTIVFGKGDDILPRLAFLKGKMIVGLQTVVWIDPVNLMDAFDACKDLLNNIRNVEGIVKNESF